MAILLVKMSAMSLARRWSLDFLNSGMGMGWVLVKGWKWMVQLYWWASVRYGVCLVVTSFWGMSTFFFSLLADGMEG